MRFDESLQRFGLTPADDALPEIRALLAAEAEAGRSGQSREEDLALLCCVQLFSRGMTEDVLRIWDAKQSCFDLGCDLGVQLLCGAGLAETKRYLSDQTSAAAAKAREYIEACESAGDFAGFSPKSYLDEYRRYFGVT